ncbi:MAG TPA: nucleoside transporter C-terminal domain-containing protein [Phycisphaerae bacterium]|jgi:CNT family concentrative nucleoside transporter
MHFLRGILGLLSLVGLAWLLSTNRRRFPIKIVLGGTILQFALALLVLKTGSGRAVFDVIGELVTLILRGADAGANFVFGPLAGNHPAVTWKAIAGIKIMTTIIVFSTLSAIGYHFGILQRVVAALAFVMTRLLGVSGAESLSCAANVFLGQTEAPLLVRPYIAGMTRSELMAVMTGGFATIAMGVMAVYVDWLGVGPDGQPDPVRAIAAARHLLTASLMSAPAAFVMAKVMLPETQAASTAGHVKVERMSDAKNALDAATSGATQGMVLAINVLAMLIAFIALITLVDLALTWLGQRGFMAVWLARCGTDRLDLDTLLGWLFSPIAYLVGVDAGDRRAFGSLLGTAMATNEMVAYGKLSELIKSAGMSERSIRMATYSLCGFANFSSMGIQIAGIGGMAPSRRPDLVSLAPRAMLGGAMASWMTGCIAGMLT